ncbi:MAG: glycerol-3-phosphate 1-O-acyltransferase PlsY [Dehalococcoidia bacterium]|nr:glycerol-3-phosphate 1-O-acyltransferase PlsY [Dehalococcoidia bacterium]
MTSLLLLLGILVLSYALGSVPVGLIVAWLKTGRDLRATGSGKTGATNVMRSAGRSWGFLTLFLDGLKAFLAVLAATLLWTLSSMSIGGVPVVVPVVQSLAGVAAIIGHNHPMFAGFRGGRGVSSFFGSMVYLNLPVALAGIAILTVVALLSRFMSLASIVAGLVTGATMVALYVVGRVPLPHAAYAAIVVSYIVYAHRDNISRLRNGTERRLY